MIFLAKDFDTRQELERKVASVLGLTADSKPSHSIQGTVGELKNLHLGHGSVFWGIRAESTDIDPVATDKKGKKKIERVNRGEIHKQKEENVDVKGSKEL